jgi:hypothetical protein
MRMSKSGAGLGDIGRINEQHMSKLSPEKDPIVHRQIGRRWGMSNCVLDRRFSPWGDLGRDHDSNQKHRASEEKNRWPKERDQSLIQPSNKEER